jgi:hypothetical protein
MAIAPLEVPAARYLSFSGTARVVKYAVLFWEGSGEAMRSIRSPLELAWMCMCGTFPATTRCSPLAEKVMARTSVVCRRVASRVSCAFQIFTVCPAAVAVVPVVELELAWEGEIATAFTSSLWALLFGGAWGTFQIRVVRSAEDAMIRRSEATRSVVLAWCPSVVLRISV